MGLVHNTELAWDRTAKAADVAKEGDEVTVLVKKIDRENKRVALSIKATQEDPWKVEAGQFHIGDIVEVEVARFLPFGAIVKLTDKVEYIKWLEVYMCRSEGITVGELSLLF